MERQLNIQTISEATKKKIRDAVGAKTVIQLIKLAQLSGVDIGIRKDKQIRETYKYFGNIENELMIERNKIREQQKKKPELKLKVFTFDMMNADFAKKTQFNKYETKAFKIVLKSALVKDIKRQNFI